MIENKSQEDENDDTVIQVLKELICKTEEMERQLEDAIRDRAKKQEEPSPKE
jgi:hypothetical protein